ncbi:unnamed protein product [Cunninghamella echinulata]
MNIHQLSFKQLTQYIFHNNNNKNSQYQSSYLLPKLRIQRKLLPKKNYHIERFYELQRYCEILLKAPTDITKSLTVLEFFGLTKADTERIVYSSTASLLSTTTTSEVTSSPSLSPFKSFFHVTPKQPPISPNTLGPTSFTPTTTANASYTSLVSPPSLSQTLLSPPPSPSPSLHINYNTSMPNLLKKKKKKRKDSSTVSYFSSAESIVSEPPPNSYFDDTEDDHDQKNSIYSALPTWNHHHHNLSNYPPSPTLSSSTSSSSFSHQLPYFRMMSPPPKDFPFTRKGNNLSKKVLPTHGDIGATNNKLKKNKNKNKNNKQQQCEYTKNRYPSTLPVPLCDATNTKQQLVHSDHAIQLNNNNDDIIMKDGEEEEEGEEDSQASSFYLHKKNRGPRRPTLKSLSSLLSTTTTATHLNTAITTSSPQQLQQKIYSPSPYIKLKVVYDLDNIIMIQVPRTIKLPELRATILYKFDEIAADLPIDFKLVFNSYNHHHPLTSFSLALTSSTSSSTVNLDTLPSPLPSPSLSSPLLHHPSNGKSSPLSAAYSTYSNLDARTIIESQEDLQRAMISWSALTKVSVRCVL